MTREAFRRWLDGITPTKPFTVADATELHAMIRAALAEWNVKIDVYTQRGQQVFIRVDGMGEPFLQVLDVV